MKPKTNRLEYQNMYRLMKNTKIRLLQFTSKKYYNKIKLLRSDLIELNPGPKGIYKLFTQKFTKHNRPLKLSYKHDISYNEFQQNFVEKINEYLVAHKFNTFQNLKPERQKWNFLNEARNSKNRKTEFLSLTKLLSRKTW